MEYVHLLLECMKVCRFKKVHVVGVSPPPPPSLLFSPSFICSAVSGHEKSHPNWRLLSMQVQFHTATSGIHRK